MAIKILKYSLIKYLLSLPELRSYVGERIYPRRVDIERGKPCIAISKQSEQREDAQDGTTGVVNSTIGFIIISDSDLQMEEIKGVIIDKLDGRKITYDGITADFLLTNDFDVEDENTAEMAEAVGALEFGVIWSID